MKTYMPLALVGIVSLLDMTTAAPIVIAGDASAAPAAAAAAFTASSAGEAVASTPSAVLSSVRAAPHTAALFAYPRSRDWSSAFQVSSTTSSSTPDAAPTSDLVSVVAFEPRETVNTLGYDVILPSRGLPKLGDTR
ncbi:hypothetical protein R3P38DRAFT_3208853 [Favolaschia claudopus]|uniref:Secreted protein n=1 Tax=Favolaschia claudopus TaxID=2862362 RepID=A0AAW0AIG1_9AGAR